MASSSSPFSFVFSASFTSEPIAPTVKSWGEVLQSNFACAFAPFGQIMQSLLDPIGAFASNRHGMNVLLFRWQDLGNKARRADNAAALAKAIETRGPQFDVPLIVIPCPGEPCPFSLPDTPNVFLLGQERIDGWYPVADKFSSQGDELGAIPYTENYFAALGSAVVRAAHAINHSPYKVLCLDCDNTLWQGICGEDGPDGVRLREGHRALQNFAIAQRNAGTLLTLASKNNLEDVRETFEGHPEFPLRWTDITAHRIDWNPKSDSVQAMADELSLGLDGFVFLDDNPKEVSEMDERLPQVLSLTLPADPADFPGYLNHLWAFDRLRVTAEDSGRANSYRSVQEFGKALHEAHSFEQFYRSLELEVEVRPISAEEAARAAQLTQRTNQFNLTTIRRGEAELIALASSGLEIFGVHVRDRFGDYGFTGLAIGRPWAGEYQLENFLLSCRVLGRGVEHRVLGWIAAHALTKGCEKVLVSFVESARNTPAKEFLLSLGWTDFPVHAPAQDLQSLCFEPARQSHPPAARKETATAPPRHEVDYARIATSMRTVAQIRQARSLPLRSEPLHLATETESALAVIWRDLLGTDVPGGESGFFDLGGHSLLVVLLLMRIKDRFGIALGIDDVYAADVTLERMARRIDETIAFDGVGGEEYGRILAVIEAMSDEEAEKAFNEESPRHAHPVSR